MAVLKDNTERALDEVVSREEMLHFQRPVVAI